MFTACSIPRGIERSASLARAAVLLATLLLSACRGEQATHGTGADSAPAAPESAAVATGHTVIDILRSEGDFSMFVAALDTVGLASTLDGPGRFTVFAPTNAAIEQWQGEWPGMLAPESRDSLRGILQYHVTQGEVMLENAALMPGVTTLRGDDLAIGLQDGQMTVNGTVVGQGITADNGAVHVVGTVLRPQARPPGQP